MYDVYLTSTFTNEWNVRFNPLIGKALVENGFHCCLPEVKKEHETAEDIFKRDKDGIQNAKCILAIAKNESPNWGAEVGFAYGRNIPIIALLEKGHDIPLICGGMIREKLEVDSLEAIDEYISILQEKIKYFL